MWGGRNTGYLELRRMVMRRRTEKSSRLPPWSLTFADLMMLLLTFFVMLSSLSEMDKEKYRRMSMALSKELETRPAVPAEPVALPAPPEKLDKENFAQWVTQSLQEEVANKSVELEAQSGALTVRLNESLAFPTASANVNQDFLPVLGKIASLIEKTDGQIVVAGHTDDIPIRSFRFPSNWELSSARAAAVAQSLMARAKLPPQRFMVEGHADTQPLVENDSDAHRAQNRRVEIRVVTVPAKTEGEDKK